MKKIEDYYVVRCKCVKCDRPQVRRISEVVAGEKCRITRLGQPQCDGELNYYSEDIEDATDNAVNVLGFLNATLMKNHPNEKLAELVDTVTDDIGTWREAHATPQEMGWVGQDGRP